MKLVLLSVCVYVCAHECTRCPLPPALLASSNELCMMHLNSHETFFVFGSNARSLAAE